MRDLLSDLHERFPSVLRGKLGAVGTLTVLDEILDFKNLFKDSVGENLYSQEHHEHLS